MGSLRSDLLLVSAGAPGPGAGLGNAAPGPIAFALPLVIGAWEIGWACLAWVAIPMLGACRA